MPGWLSRVLALAVAYLAFGALALQTARPPSVEVPVWPPTGIALIALTVGGYRLWPGVFVGAFLTFLASARSFAPDLAPGGLFAGVAVIATAHTLQAAAGAWLLRCRFGATPTLHSPRDILYFLAVAGPVHCAIAASVCASGFCAFGMRPWAELGPTWLGWWWNDAVGGAVFGAVTLTAIGRPSGVWRPRRWSVGLPLTVAVGLMAVGFTAAREADDQQARDRLADEAEQAAAVLNAHLGAIESGLGGLRDGYRLDLGLTDPVEWDRVKAAMGVYQATNPAVRTTGLIALVPGSVRAWFEAAVRQEPGMQSFRLTEPGSDGSQRPVALRDRHVIVRRITPLRGSRQAIGVDMASDPDRGAALARAEVADGPTASAPVRLLQTPDGPRSVVLFLPVRTPTAGRVVGFLAASLDREKLMAMARGGRPTEVAYALAHPATEPPPSTPAGGETTAVPLAFGGEAWEVRAVAGPGFVAANRGQSARLAGAAGFGAVFLFAALLLIVTGQTGLVRAEVLARTADLEREAQAREFTEEWLKGSEDRLAEAQRIARLGYWEWDPLADEVAGSGELARVLDRPRPDRQPLAAFLAGFHPDDRPRLEAAARAAGPTGERAAFEARVVAPDGGQRWAACTVAGSGSGLGVTVRGTVQDVTDRKAAEERNQVHNLTARLLAESSSLGQAMPAVLAAVCRAAGWHVGEFWRPTPDGAALRRAYHWAADGLAGFVAASAAREVNPGEGAAGRSWATGRPQRMTDLTDPDRFCRPAEAAAHGLKSAVAFPVVAGGQTVGVLTFFSRRPKDVSAADIDMLRAVTGQLAGWVERAAAEERVRLNEERFRALLQFSSDVIVVLDRAGNSTFLSDAAARLFGHRPDQLLGRPVFDEVHPDDRSAVRVKFAEAVAHPGRTVRAECRFKRADGSYAAVEAVGAALFDRPAVGGLLINARDITDRRRADEERGRYADALQQTQRMDSLGALAGGVAHDFNNLLTGILGNANLARELIPPAADLHEFLRPIEQAAEQAAQLCQQMLAYAGRGGAAREVIDLNRLLADSADLIRLAAGKRAAVRLDPADGLPLFEADPGRLRQVVLNLVQNAAEATADGGGPVVVRTGIGRPSAGQTLSEFDGTLSDATGRPAPAPPPAVVWVEVEGRGCGMDEAVRGRMFEPFFTTKFAGRGLGLSAVHGIVRQHGGEVCVTSEPGRGTTVRVYLPAAGLAGVSLTVVPPTEPVRPARAALVADDEPIVRQLAAMAVRGLGYEAVEAADGRTAVALVAADPGRFAVVLLDVGMPALDGPTALAELRRLRPDLPAVLMSGYAAGDLSDLPTDPGVRFLAKPFRQADLTQCLQAAVGG